jgi:Protein of unknown function (DUF2800)
MAEHSKLPPSSAARRVACPGSRALEERYPEVKESPHAREGEAAHWVASQMIVKHFNLSLHAHPKPLATIAPNGEVITTEMFEGADLYLSSIKSVIDDHGDQDLAKLLHIEERIDISRIHPDCWGTPDCWLFVSNELYIWDYKFGHGFVDVFENWQLTEYCAGIIDKLSLTGIQDQHTWVNFYIVQPRNYHRDGSIRSWRIKASELRGLFNILSAAEAEASKPQATCKPSPECAYCLGRHACEALQRSALSSVDVAVLNTPWELAPHSIGNELRYLKRATELLDARITGLEEQITAMIRRGDRVPFFKLEQSQGRDKWKSDAREIMTLGEMLGYDLSKPAEVVTPKQAIKMGVPEEVVHSYTERTNGAMKLVLDEENTARKIFGGNT